MMKEEKPLWVLYPKVDNHVKLPKSDIRIELVVQNLSESALYFSKAEIFASWVKDKKGIKRIETKDYIPSGASMLLTIFNLQLPSTPGLYTLKFALETWIYNCYTANWKNLGVLKTADWGYIQVTPNPIYSVFVSCSLRPEDKPVVDRIIDMIKIWGFNPKIVGVNRFSEDPLRIPDDIKKEIDSVDAVIAIATPRDFSIIDKAYRTFSWLQLETGMAFKSDKPLLFIVDERIKPEGLLEYPNFPKVFYHPTKLDVLEHRLAIVMPGFREYIAVKKQEDFLKGLVKAGLILGGFYLVGKLLEEK